MISHYVCYDLEGARFESEELGVPAPNEVIIRSTCSLISAGTERASLQGILPGPGRLGYSLVGTIEEVGAQVTGLALGERVMAVHHHCDWARRAVDPWVVQPIPDEVSNRAAAFTVLASVAAHFIERAQLHIGEGVLIAGAGVVGLLTAQLARIAGADPVIVTDLRPETFEMAHRVGITNTVPAGSAEELRASIETIAPPESISVLIEVCCSTQAIKTLVALAPLGARVVVTGSFADELVLPDAFDALVSREISIIGAHQPKCPRQRHIYYPWSQSDNRAMVLRLLAEGRLIVEPLITHVVAARELPSFYADLKSGAVRPTAALINWGDHA